MTSGVFPACRAAFRAVFLLLYTANIREVPFFLEKNGVEIFASIYAYRKTALLHSGDIFLYKMLFRRVHRMLFPVPMLSLSSRLGAVAHCTVNR